jgi:hypothetical protein
MNEPRRSTKDWPVSALDGKPAKNTAQQPTSSTVVNLPSTVSTSLTFLTICADVRSLGAIGSNRIAGSFVGGIRAAAHTDHTESAEAPRLDQSIAETIISFIDGIFVRGLEELSRGFDLEFILAEHDA